MRILKLMTFLALQSALLLQTGCSHIQPDDICEDDIKEKPGLFSGEKGYFDLSL